MTIESHGPAQTWVREWYAETGAFKVRIEFTSIGNGFWSGPRCTLWSRRGIGDWIPMPLAVVMPEAPGMLEELAQTITVALGQLNDDRPDMPKVQP